MPKEDTHTSPTTPASAPELPHHVAKQYNLHKEGIHPTEPLPTEAGAGTSAADLSTEEKQGSVIVDDSKTDAAVDDILAKESDQLLAVQDAVVPKYVPTKKKGKLRRFFAAWWRNKWARWITILIILACIVTTVVWQKSRYAILNTAGVRSSASVIVLDNTTQLPLKNVRVSLDSMQSMTDKDGRARFKNLKLGPYELTIKRVAFAEVKRDVTIGWGSNPLGSFKIRATGTQYTILVTDYLSGKAIKGAEANSDEASALSDDKGKIVLTVDDTDVTKLSVRISKEGYKDQGAELNAESTATASIALVPDVKEVYVSKQSGKYDVYAADLDGQNKKLLLAGTGKESANISLVVSPDNKQAAVISTRDNITDADGYTLQALTILDLTDGTHVTVDHAEQIQFVDWVGNRLIYRMTLAGASAADSQRNRIISYNYGTNSRLQLATANQFNAILSTKGYVYYGVSGNDPDATLGLFKVKTDGSGRKQLSEDEVWTAVRVNYDVIGLQTPDGWQSFTLSSEKIDKISQPSLTTREYIENRTATKSLWTDTRDGLGTLLLHDNNKNSDKVLLADSGISAPVRWASDDVVIYRVANNGETADYALSVSGGRAKKLTDVTASYGYAQTY